MAKNSDRSPPPEKPETAKPPENKTAETIESSIERELAPILANLPHRQREDIILRVIGVARTATFSGPLPHPGHLGEYDRIVPGSADRMLRMAEETLEHNRAVARKAQASDHLYRLLGMLLGFSALILLVAAAVYAGLNGNNILAGLLLGTGVFSCVGVFVSAHVRRD
ncbi:putative membrane protein [Neorhizobium huautlense]|uniref:Membrane protein n=1 Tax=Neorhizobium huautlense TaxID=67774 RepID=A0ABT9PWA5_9HYPH|nr:DUF2335 domain-containing protein [Neorhizobium huautlense]MDP9838159.1 putative membrane protein [Neorhizobium huautlense]